MEIKSCSCGAYQTNCYLVTIDSKTLIIDPGQHATSWVLEHVTNPIAILNTHGHFDHVWSNAELQKQLNIPIYVPDEDAFMLENDPFGQGTPSSHPDHRIHGDTALDIAGITVGYHHFPGHTPGNSVIEIGGHWFSGDFLFLQSIGRWDFPYSSAADMIRSLQRAQQITKDYPIHPGHGPATTLAAEQKLMNYWIETVKASI
jgi:glyoxylase-like metal-dependent hydrolase (beta-lactamase superfamily II)